MKDSFVFYNSYEKAILLLDSAESQMRTLKAIWDFAFRGVEPDENKLSNTELIIFSMAKPTIEASIRSYENGKKGGAPMGNQNARKQKQPINNPQTTPPLTNDNVNVNFNDNLNANVNSNATDNSNDKVNSNVKDKKNVNDSESESEFKQNQTTPHSLIPTLKDVQNFCVEQKLAIDPVKFWTYYNVRKWKNVKNWQSQVFYWQSTQFDKETDYNSTDAIPSV